MIEKVYYNDTEYVEFDIPDEGNVGCFMSGGADSSLMCYILADTIKKHNLKTEIYPITAEFLQRPYNLRCAYDVVKKVSDLTGFQFNLHNCFIIPNHREPVTDDQKVVIMGNYTRTYANCFRFKTIFNGLTANPPEEDVEDTPFAKRQKCRDNEEWRKEQQSKDGLTVPFINVDKRVISTLYKKFNLLENLLPLTRSCEAELEETHYFTKDCFDFKPKGEECWWCKERAYGFGEYVSHYRC